MQPDTGHIECKQLAKIASLFVFASPDYNIYLNVFYIFLSWPKIIHIQIHAHIS